MAKKLEVFELKVYFKCAFIIHVLIQIRILQIIVVFWDHQILNDIFGAFSIDAMDIILLQIMFQKLIVVNKVLSEVKTLRQLKLTVV